MQSEESLQKLKKHIEVVLESKNKCPWHKEIGMQGHIDELRNEIRELEEAVEKNDLDNIEEETGDILNDVLSLIAVVSQEYDIPFPKIVDRVTEKMIRRKPHVFGDEKVESVEEAVKIWERVKKEEKNR